MGELEIYLDYAAATPLDSRVFLAMQPYLKTEFFNPSASYQKGRQVRHAVEEARHRLAMVLGAKPREIIMTAGATESINLAVHGVMKTHGGTMLVSSIEHPAVQAAAQHYQAEYLSTDPRGWIKPQIVAALLSPVTTLVSIAMINNELGTVQSLREIARIIDDERQRRLATGEVRPLYLHTDASQAAGLLDLSVSRLGIDLLTLNAGKCYGPKQVGLLWVRTGVSLSPLIDGGGQESGLRGGTENVAGVVGFSEALTIAQHERKAESYRLSGLRERLQTKLLAAIPDLVVNGHPKHRAPHLLHVSVPGLDGERAVFACDERGVMLATGSACAANRGTRSHVLTAVGMSDELADGSLRMSVGRHTTETDIDRAAAIIAEVVQMERGQ